MSSIWWLSLGCLLVALGVGAGLRRSAVHMQLQAAAENRRRWLALRDALQAMPQLPDVGAMVDAVKDAVAQTTCFRAHLLLSEQDHITEDQVTAAPFCVEPYLATMAMRQRQRVSSAALAPLGWGCAYIPLCAGNQVRGVLVLAMPEAGPWRPEDLACCDILAQSLGACMSAATALKA
ncbi:GAF domain-containing protein [Limnohabitans planktonicus]|uniref:GAF domain-containing protein n=1 Tax=Limnohabitans planktonicus II-D5 TaxID=1293045 RepID=A0A2T7U8K5_9BURK|nr:GAF domain-containing protein [Limnohabitans planktonicus]PVE40971.1 GAF domain-containing protein [Limnohabitans planktonicus II-D5]